MKYTRKYLQIISIAIIILIAVPIFINALCLIPCEYASSQNDWIGFWGAYIGSFISVVGSFCVFALTFKNDKKIREEENRERRRNEITKREYETRKNNLDELVDDLILRLEHLNFDKLYNAAIELIERKSVELDLETKKILIYYYYRTISEKKTFEIKYSHNYSSDAAKEFERVYYERIGNILVFLNNTVLISNCTEAYKVAKAILASSGNNDAKTENLYNKMIDFVNYERRSLENYRVKHSL